jgi:hypothetical protein
MLVGSGELSAVGHVGFLELSVQKPRGTVSIETPSYYILAAAIHMIPDLFGFHE